MPASRVLPTDVDAPTGVVALVFTDVQGSTALWEHGPALMRDALAVHNNVLRRTIAEVGGYEVKTEGDAFMVAFRSAADGVRWCLAAQIALLDADWPDAIFDRPEAAIARGGETVLFRGLRVRMGVHVGEPDCRPDPVTGRMDYFGPVVNRAARVSAAGHGGQVLASRASLAMAGTFEADVLDLGEHRLKGLITSEHLFQVLPHRVAGRTFPPVRTLAAPRTNLSPTASPLLGRRDELARVDERLAGARAITIAGPGGAGKTRLAREHALARLDQYNGGAWFCDLAQASSGDDVQAAIAGVLGVALPAAASSEMALEMLGRALAARERILLVLDAVDDVHAPVAAMLDAWAHAAPRAAFVITARQPLGLADEDVLELGPLDDEAALRLLLDRARRSGADLEPDRDRAALDELARAVERLPLALELAGPRLRVLPPAPLTARLAQGIELMRRAARDPAQHPPLRAAIAVSWDLLDGPERAAIAQITAFRGSFTIEAAEAVLALDDDAAPVLDVVQALRDRSLLATHRSPGLPPRFSLYDSVRAFVEGVADPEERGAAADRHARHYVALGERLMRESEGPRAPVALAELGREIDNLRAVLFCQHEAHPGLAARASLILDHVLAARGPGALRQDVLDAGLAASHACAHGTQRARLHLARARLALERGAFDACEHELGIAEARCTGVNEALITRVWYQQAQLVRARGGYAEARALYDRALNAVRDDVTRALLLDGRAEIEHDNGELASAQGDARTALDAAVRAGDRRLEARVHRRLGAIRHDAGELEAADEAYRAALEAVRALGEPRLEGQVLAELGDLLGDRGALVEAAAMLDGALPLLEACGDALLAGHALLYRGLVTLRGGSATGGRASLERALEHHHAAGARRFEAIDHAFLGVAALLAGDVRAARAALARAEAGLGHADGDLRAYVAAFAAVAAARAGDTAAAKLAWSRSAETGAPRWLAAARGHLAPCCGQTAPLVDDQATRAVLAAAVARAGA